MLNKNHYPVIIAGGGPVGLTCAALLASYGIECVVIEGDEGYCTGSRAICVSRRSQEILAWCGADTALTSKGLPWTGGRSYYQGNEVLHFQMPHDATQRFAPMVNIQQYYIEQFAHEAGQRTSNQHTAKPLIAWGYSAQTVTPHNSGATLDIKAPQGDTVTLHCDWLIACDGGRSTVREQLGLQLEGVQYDGKYVIVDIKQASQRPTERLAWFDPPSNPGSTILMHRQPDGVWRIDYQIADDEDPIEAVKPENVLPRVQSHLDMMGETAPWQPLWISLYNAKCLTLPNYRPSQGHGRVLFAGDAAHLVPIFGVRGLNSGIDDVGNLAWKLAAVLQGQAKESLLDSYSTERLAAARENIAYGAKSTEFMAPPHRGFELMRQAALRLALESPVVRSLINPRQSLPVEYVGSALNHGAPENNSMGNVRAGMVAPDAPYSSTYISAQFGKQFTLLHFGDITQAPLGLNGQVNVINLTQRRNPLAWQRYEANEGLCVLVRPDGYIMALWASPQAVDLNAALARLHT